MLKSIATISLTLALFACNRSDSTIEKSALTEEKSEEIKTIDNEIARISINPQQSYDYCEAKSAIKSLDKLANTEEGKEYVKKNQTRLLEVLRRYLNDVTEEAAVSMIDKKQIHDVAFQPMWSAYRGWNIVTTDEEKTTVSNSEGIFTMTTVYRYTIKKSGGLFGSDQYVSRKGKGIAKFILRCNSNEDPVSYTGKILE